MKKLLSIILATLLICSTFVSCGKEEEPSSSAGSSSTVSQAEIVLTSYDVKFDDIKKGYINHISGGEASIVEKDGYESTEDFYLYLPRGSVISCEREFAVHCYNESFSANFFMMQNSGQTVDGFNPEFTADKVTLSSTCYVRISVKGSLSEISVEVPEELVATVITGSREEMELTPKILVANEYLQNKEASVNYIFITDLHNGSYVNDPDGDGLRNYDSVEDVSKRLESRRGLVEQAVAIANKSPYIDFIVAGGDFINGYETEESLTYQAAKKKDSGLTVKEHVIDQLQEILAPLEDCEKPVFILAGNHDDNGGHSLWQETNHPNDTRKIADYMLSDLDWDKGVFSKFVNVKVVRDNEYTFGGKSVSKYYYYDLEKEGKTVRIICLDAKDARLAFDSKGNIIDANPSRNGGVHYTDEQMKWLAEVALKGEFDECIMLSHAGTDLGTNKLEKIINAYQSNGIYSQKGSVSIDVSYSGRTSGDILLYHHGHDHEEFHNYSMLQRFWTVSTAPGSSTFDIMSASSRSVFRYNMTDSKTVELTRTGEER